MPGARDDRRQPRRGPVSVSWAQVTAFRLSRHHLDVRARSHELASVARDMAGAQAQVLLAAQMSLWARVGGLRLSDLETALWKDRRLAKTWCMRRTMFLVPSNELAVFVRGSARRAEREFRWVLSRGVPEQELEKLIDGVLQALDRPTTQTELARAVSGSLGYRMRFKRGGGWGSRSEVPCVEVRGLAYPASYLLHLAGARGVYCSGPSSGNESTFVRADRWIPGWKDMPREQAERELALLYLEAYGPSTVSDFALWTGMFAGDAREIWSRIAPRTAEVDIEGQRASVLESDLPELQAAKVEGHAVSLLPYFDSFLLGHKSHRNIVGPEHHKQVYRAQGWVSPVLLVDGRARGVWSYARKSGRLETLIRPFSRLPEEVTLRLREEAADLGKFLGCESVTVKVA